MFGAQAANLSVKYLVSKSGHTVSWLNSEIYTGEYQTSMSRQSKSITR